MSRQRYKLIFNLQNHQLFNKINPYIHNTLRTSPTYNKQYMKVKLKQSKSISKNFQLPSIKALQQYRYTPRIKHNNRSLPKIPQPTILEYSYINSSKNNIQLQQKQKIRDKIKSHQYKNKQQVVTVVNHDDSFSSNIDEANATYNFKKEIEKNLVFIKKEKENRKKVIKGQKTRYNTPRHFTLQNESKGPKKSLQKRSEKCLTEQGNVFSKLNQIITKSQSRSTHINQPRHISFSSYITKDSKPDYQSSISNYKQQLRTQTQNNNIPTQQSDKSDGGASIKNQQNYHEWRKLSIDSDQEKKVCYHLSSFDNQTDRLEKIRNKNEMSLKKYIDGRSYLSKLIKYKDSTLQICKDHQRK